MVGQAEEKEAMRLLMTFLFIIAVATVKDDIAQGWVSFFVCIVLFLLAWVFDWYNEKIYGKKTYTADSFLQALDVKDREIEMWIQGRNGWVTAYEELSEDTREIRADLFEWLSLARRQYNDMPHNAPFCPTLRGINKTEKLLRIFPITTDTPPEEKSEELGIGRIGSRNR